MGENVPFDRVRKMMALHMEQSHAEIVPVTLYDKVDIDEWNFEKPDITIRILRAIVAGARKERFLNSHYHKSNSMFEVFEEVNVGVAMDVKERGLFVPVLHNVNTHTQEDLRKNLSALKNKAHNGKLELEDLQGGTITLTNFGTLAGMYATPIIVPPQVAILGVGRIHDESVVVCSGVVEKHRFMPLSLTFDHRAITGGEAARFLEAIMTDLENPK